MLMPKTRRERRPETTHGRAVKEPPRHRLYGMQILRKSGRRQQD